MFGFGSNASHRLFSVSTSLRKKQLELKLQSLHEAGNLPEMSRVLERHAAK